MYDRVDKLADRIERLDDHGQDEFGNKIPSPIKSDRDTGFLRLLDSPFPKILMLFAAILCGSVLFDAVGPWNSVRAPNSVETSAPTRDRAINVIDDIFSEAPFVKINETHNEMIEYTYLSKMRSQTLHQNYEIELVNEAGRSFDLHDGACEIQNNYPIAKRICRTRIPYKLADGSYKIRLSANYSAFGNKTHIESTPVNITRPVR